MTVLAIILYIGTLAALVASVIFINGHSEEKFHHKLLTKSSFVGIIVSVFAINCGQEMYFSASGTHGDILNGILIFLIGIAMVSSIVMYKVKKTNLLYGIGGMAIEIPLFFTILQFGMPFIALGLVGLFFFFSVVQPVWVVNR